METGPTGVASSKVNLVSRCCFHCFQVSLVPKITQILHKNVPDTFLTCYRHVSIKYLFYRNGLVSSKKSVSILAVSK